MQSSSGWSYVHSSGDDLGELLIPPGGSFSRSALMIGLASLLVTMLNFAASVFIARLFGAGRATDALFMAVTVGNSIAPPLISSVDAVFLPLFYRLSSTERMRLGRQSVIWFGGLFVSIGIVIWASREAWLPLFLHNLAPYQPNLDRLILVSAIAFVSLGVLLTIQKTLLTGELRFKWIAITNLIPPASIVISILALHRLLGEMAVMAGMAVGSMAAVIVATLATPDRRSRGRGVFYARQLMRMTLANLPLAVSAMLFALNGLILRATASLNGAGGISAQYYAERLFFLPHTLIAVSAAAVILPFLLSWTNREEQTIARTVIYGFLLMGPVTLILLIFASDIVVVVLQHGRFTAEAGRMTAAAIRGYSLGLAPLFVATVSWRILQSRGALSMALGVGAVFFATTLSAAIPLFYLWGMFGVGATNTLGALVAMLASLAFLSHGSGSKGRLRTLLPSLGKLAMALTVMALVALGATRLLEASAAWMRLGLAVVASCVVYAAVLYAMGVKEFRELRRLHRWL